MDRLVSEKERVILLANIDRAFASTEPLTGWEMDFLNNIRAQATKYGSRWRLTENQVHRLDQIFLKTDAFPPRISN